MNRRNQSPIGITHVLMYSLDTNDATPWTDDNDNDDDSWLMTHDNDRQWPNVPKEFAHGSTLHTAHRLHWSHHLQFWLFVLVGFVKFVLSVSVLNAAKDVLHRCRTDCLSSAIVFFWNWKCNAALEWLSFELPLPNTQYQLSWIEYE